MNKIFYSLILMLFTTTFLFANKHNNKCIFLVDVSGSMAGYNSDINVFPLVKSQLIETFNRLDDDVETVVVPFASKTFPALRGKGNSLVADIEKLFVVKGNSDIYSAWNVGIKEVEQSKNNYLFLVSDGIQNMNYSQNELLARLKDFSKLTHKTNTSAYYLQLSEKFRNNEISKVFADGNKMYVIDNLQDFKISTGDSVNNFVLVKEANKDKETVPVKKGETFSESFTNKFILYAVLISVLISVLIFILLILRKIDWRKNNVQEIASETIEKIAGKEVISESIQKSGKELWSEGIRPATKQVAKQTIEIPTGGKSIETIFDKKLGKFVPTFDNLSGKVKLSADDDAKLLKERRKNIAPYYQFLTKEQSKKVNSSELILGEKKDGAILKRNLFATMPSKVKEIVEAFGGAEAHHIVGDCPDTKEALKLFKKLGVDINDPRNGILLPSDGKSIFKGAIHRGGHTEEYHKWVWSQIKDSKTQEELFDNLRGIAHKLYEGKAPLYNRNIINSNGMNAVVKNI